MSDSNMPPAGWYPDPNAPGRQRYWDGANWAQTESPTQPIPAVAPVATKPSSSGGTTWWKRTWVIALAAGILGLIIGAASAGGGDDAEKASGDPAPTVTVTAEPTATATVTESVTEEPEAEEEEDAAPAKAEGKLPLEDGDWRLDKVSLKDQFGDFSGTARITYIGESQNADNFFTITVLNKKGDVIASLDGFAEGMDPGGTETVDLISTDSWKAGPYAGFDFQKQF